MHAPGSLSSPHFSLTDKLCTSPHRLNHLNADLAKYKDFVKAMEKGKGHGVRYQPLDDDGVYRLAKQFYAMPHYGQMLKDLAKTIGRAYAATFPEKPYRIRGKYSGMNDSSHPGDNRQDSAFATNSLPEHHRWTGDSKSSSTSKPFMSMIEMGEAVTNDPDSLLREHSFLRKPVQDFRGLKGLPADQAPESPVRNMFDESPPASPPPYRSNPADSPRSSAGSFENYRNQDEVRTFRLDEETGTSIPALAAPAPTLQTMASSGGIKGLRRTASMWMKKFGGKGNKLEQKTRE